eukprot:Gb_33696 [translate_table: standard]
MSSILISVRTIMTATLVAFLLLLVVQPIWARKPASLLPGQQQGNCSYTVEIETTCAPFAETEDHISLRFGDSAGNHVIAKHLKHPKWPVSKPRIEGEQKEKRVNHKPFERCGLDKFKVKGPCMQADACYLYLKRIGSDKWRPGYAKVHRANEDGSIISSSGKFYFRTFLPGHVWFGYDYCNAHQLPSHHKKN